MSRLKIDKIMSRVGYYYTNKLNEVDKNYKKGFKHCLDLLSYGVEKELNIEHNADYKFYNQNMKQLEMLLCIHKHIQDLSELVDRRTFLVNKIKPGVNKKEIDKEISTINEKIKILRYKINVNELNTRYKKLLSILRDKISHQQYIGLLEMLKDEPNTHNSYESSLSSS